MSVNPLQSIVWTEQFEGPDPPEYTDSVAPPDYSFNLGLQESRLLVSYGGRLRYVQHGVFTKCTKKKDIIFNVYEHNERSKSPPLPVFGQSARLEGSVALSFRPDQIASVTVKLDGTLKLAMTDWRDETITLVDLTTVLWSHSGKSPLPPLPSEIPYSFRMPTHYTAYHGSENLVLPLPPSYSVDNSLAGMDGFRANVSYNITVEVEMAKARFNKRNTLTIPFRYWPRSTPPLPTILPPATFLNTLKVAPEEWMHRTGHIKSRRSDISPLEVSVVLPKGAIYPLNSPLPFHIQLQGTSQALQLFTSSAANANMNITLRRKVGVEVKEREGWLTSVIGEGKISPIHGVEVEGASDNSVFAWNGEILSVVDDAVGTFRAVTSPFGVYQHFVPIVLTTDHFDSMGMGENSQV